MSDPEPPEGDRPLARSLRRLAIALTLPLVGAALLWWFPRGRMQTIWVSLAVIVVALAGWYIWRDES